MTTYIIVGIIILFFIINGGIRHQRARNKVVRVTEENCKGCQLCAKRCRKGALSIINKKAILNPDKCTACGHCVAECKFNALEITNRRK